MTRTCEVCAEVLEEEGLRSGPLERVCLDCLSAVERRALEHDLELAAQVQARLLPARNFTFGPWQIHYHYQPLGAVSGDHIDLIRPDRTGDALHFLFGDVSGKGIAASILMANLQALFRSLVSQDLPLGEIVRRANELFSESTAARSFATVVAGRLTADGALELSNAGHLAPLLVTDSAVTPVSSAAPPLGFARSRFVTSRFEFRPQDFLFLYTDGISEASDENGEEYGATRLTAALEGLRGRSAQNVVDAVVQRVDSFQDGIPRQDDVAAMAIRWRGPRDRREKERTEHRPPSGETGPLVFEQRRVGDSGQQLDLAVGGDRRKALQLEGPLQPISALNPSRQRDRLGTEDLAIVLR